MQTKTYKTDTKLKSWLRENGTTYQQFADKLDVTLSAVSHWANGRRIPPIGTALRIEDLTGGQVTARDLLPTPTAPLEKEEEVLV